MPRKRSPVLTDGEVRIMTVLWEKQEATVAEVVGALRTRPQLAYNTVQTMLGILETKGYVAHEKAGRAFVYRPVIDWSEARRSALGYLIKKLFANSPSLLVLDVLKDERTDPAEVRRLKKLIEDASSDG